jgi:hypothetical protein
MGLDRVVQEQNEKKKYETKNHGRNNTSSNVNNLESTKLVTNRPETQSQKEKLTERKNETTIATRNPDHQKKIDKVKSMFNLK